jgi:hypothetical protein
MKPLTPVKERREETKIENKTKNTFRKIYVDVAVQVNMTKVFRTTASVAV